MVTRAITLATEQSYAFWLGVPIAFAEEADAAVGITAVREIAIGLATETDSAFALSSAKHQAIGLAEESSISLRCADIVRSASETDEAMSVTPVRYYAIGLPSSTESAQACPPVRSIPIGRTSETDSTFACPPMRGRSIGQAIELDDGLDSPPVRLYPIGLPSTTASALTATPMRTHAAGIASETESAFALIATKSISLASESDSALTVRAVRSIPIGQTSETDTAQTITPTREHALGLAQESSLSLSILLLDPIARETDIALPLSIFGGSVGVVGGGGSAINVTIVTPHKSGEVVCVKNTGSIVSDNAYELVTSLVASPDDFGDLAQGSTSAAIDLTANDVDAQNGNIVVTSLNGAINYPVTLPNGDTIALAGDNKTATVTVAASTTPGSYTYQYTIIDDDGDTAASTFAYRVTFCCEINVSASADNPQSIENVLTYQLPGYAVVLGPFQNLTEFQSALLDAGYPLVPTVLPTFVDQVLRVTLTETVTGYATVTFDCCTVVLGDPIADKITGRYTVPIVSIDCPTGATSSSLAVEVRDAQGNVVNVLTEGTLAAGQNIIVHTHDYQSAASIVDDLTFVVVGSKGEASVLLPCGAYRVNPFRILATASPDVSGVGPEWTVTDTVTNRVLAKIRMDAIQTTTDPGVPVPAANLVSANTFSMFCGTTQTFEWEHVSQMTSDGGELPALVFNLTDIDFDFDITQTNAIIGTGAWAFVQGFLNGPNITVNGSAGGVLWPTEAVAPAPFDVETTGADATYGYWISVGPSHRSAGIATTTLVCELVADQNPVNISAAFGDLIGLRIAASAWYEEITRHTDGSLSDGEGVIVTKSTLRFV